MTFQNFLRSSRLCAVTPTAITNKLHIGVIGAPFNKGQVKRHTGVENGPQAIKNTGFIKELKNLGLQVEDYGNVEMQQDKNECEEEGPSGEHCHKQVLEYSQRLASSVTRVVKDGRVCVTLGGDHSTAIGTITGVAQANTDHQVVVLWVDAHADINTGSTSTSGNMHGMPVSYLLRELADQVNRLPDNWPKPCMSANHIAYIGLRDVDNAEQQFLDKLNILAFGMSDVDKLGLCTVIKRCLEHLKPSATRPLHLSFDIDSLDPYEAPSTGTPVRGGLNLREGLLITEAVRETGHLTAIDLVEVNPQLGDSKDADHTAQAARLILLGALHGHRGT
ncbi:arginase, hepatic-like [Homarus americanus]|uniref:arginase, hepatic-like n=1 Tax=Homarus americanus TaxID=6706 RepID=UPI001C446C2F|nr:arginase, hepatic-like [Homarus americanus]XP_042221207.1 arginase, hepatic-like [Homarus americanus]XP_042221208.1 arginase, hepatic-like [Homarus americanus]